MNLNILPPRFRIEILSKEHGEIVLNTLYELGYSWCGQPRLIESLLRNDATAITGGRFEYKKLTYSCISRLNNEQFEPEIPYIEFPLDNDEP